MIRRYDLLLDAVHFFAKGRKVVEAASPAIFKLIFSSKSGTLLDQHDIIL